MKPYKDNSVASVVRNSKAFNDPKLNPHLAPGYPANTLRSRHPDLVEVHHKLRDSDGKHVATVTELAPAAKRIRQGEPKLGKWEAEWLEMVKRRAYTAVKAQSLRLRLANGAWYKGDVSAIQESTKRLHIFEVKGGKKMKGVAKGLLAIKVAAAMYPEFVFVLCWKEGSQWRQQEVLA